MDGMRHNQRNVMTEVCKTNLYLKGCLPWYTWHNYRGYFYAISFDCENSPIKFGYSYDPVTRAKSFETGFPFKMKVLMHFLAHYKVERCIMQAFREHRITGEWFWPGENLMRFVHNPPEFLSDVTMLDWYRTQKGEEYVYQHIKRTRRELSREIWSPLSEAFKLMRNIHGKNLGTTSTPNQSDSG